ncbi:MAG: SpoIID/LytB domain-containing protein, partial [Acidimicrobiales bacterium]
PIVTSQSAFTVGGTPVAAGQAVEVVQQSATAAAVYVGPGCGGPWPGSPTFTSSNPVVAPGATEPFPDDGTLASKVLQLCRTSGNEEVRGDIDATQNSDGQDRTVNVLPLDWYVADSAAAESPGSWGTLGSTDGAPQGEPLGFQQTEAQVVATRSYVASSPGGYGGYADICDSTACQSYPGTEFENATTDAAVLDTDQPSGSGSADGQVVLLPNGSVATTQYSASTGGYTAPGTFAAVVDAGDSVCEDGVCNPYHQYDVTIPVSAITSKFAQLGTLESVDITQRNGFGDFGGRVLQMALVGSGGSVSLTGDQFASDFASFGLDHVALSDWFDVTSEPSGGVGGYWLGAADGGVFSFGNATFHGSMGGQHLDAPVVAMAGTADRDGYWLGAADGGVFSFGDAKFYGSLPEVAEPGGAVDILPTDTGDGYLIVTADGRAVAFGDAPQFGDVAGTVHGYGGRLVGGVTVPQ